MSSKKVFKLPLKSPDLQEHLRCFCWASLLGSVWCGTKFCVTTQPQLCALPHHSSTAFHHCEKKRKKKASQFVVSIFHSAKLRCGSRGSMVLTIQTNYVSTGGNRSQPFLSCSSTPGTMGQTHAQSWFILLHQQHFSLHTEEMTFQRLKSTLSKRPIRKVHTFS